MESSSFDMTQMPKDADFPWLFHFVFTAEFVRILQICVRNLFFLKKVLQKTICDCIMQFTPIRCVDIVDKCT